MMDDLDRSSLRGAREDNSEDASNIVPLVIRRARAEASEVAEMRKALLKVRDDRDAMQR